MIRALGLSVLLLCGCAGAPQPAPPQPSGSRDPRVTAITGRELAERIQHPRGKATLVNVWASWCAPCAHEFPLLLRQSRALAPRGVETILLSVDEPEDRAAVEAFARRYQADEGVYVRAGDDAELMKALGSGWSGGLPATMIFGPHGELRFFHEGELEEEELIQAAELVLE
ncbi:MAG: TlpA disulfide reductase family protein [Myxococcota bacterium]